MKIKFKEIGAINIIGLIFQLVIFAFTVTTVVYLRAYPESYKFTENDATNLLVFLSLILSYRITLIILFYFFCFIFFVLLLFLTCLPLILCICFECSCVESVYDNCWENKENRNKFAKYIANVTYNFVKGKLEFVDVFVCLKKWIPDCIHYFQPCLDILGLILDFVFIPGSVAIAVVLNTQLIKGGNIVPIVLAYTTIAPLIAMFVINAIRLKRNIKVSALVRDIFQPDLGAMKDEVKNIVLDHMIASKECHLKAKCFNTDPYHRVTCHKPDEVFKLPQFDPYGRGNTVVGFHLTKIDFVKEIVRSEMKPSAKGWLGKGIYFANNLMATFYKSQNQG